MSKKKIFIGLNNTASVFNDMRSGFAELGFQTLTVSRFIQTSNIINDFSDFNIRKWINYFPLKRPHRYTGKIWGWWAKKVEDYIFKKAIKECDIFVFISYSFKDDFSDLEILKQHGKKIYFVFVGDDVRWYYAMRQEFSKYGLRPIEYDIPGITSFSTLEDRLIRIRTIEKYVDAIFSRLDQSQLQLRPFFRWNMMVRASQIVENSNQRSSNPIICHAPSSRSVKGTNFLMDALEKLRLEGIEFRVSLIENVSNEAAIRMYADADILIDQLICPGSGKLSTEALAAGTIVLSNMAYDNYPQKNPIDCPIIDVNPDTIYKILKNLINDFEFRAKHAKRGRPYVEANLDTKYFCERVLSLTDNENVDYEYHPDFFRNDYVPKDPAELNLLNKFTSEVSEEDWYKTFVPKGERDGLVF